jgi:5-methyltetrahydrofolate--homocysteine methyltransferase
MIEPGFAKTSNAAPEAFVAAVNDGVGIVGLSALLTTTMPKIEVTLPAMEAAGLRNRVKVMVGRAPVTADYAREIGADGHAADAGQAVTLAKSLFS